MSWSSFCLACVTLLWSSDLFHLVEGLNTNAKSLRSPSAWTVPKGTKFGALSNLELLPQAENDRCGKGTTRIATSAVGLNFADVFTVLGYYKAANLVRGSDLDAFVPGIEFAGTLLEDVESNPDKGIPTAIQKGESCFGFVRFGSYADVVNARPEHIRRLPPTWSPGQGAAFLVNALIAWHGLANVGGMPSLEAISKRRTPYVVVVHSASGGVGLWASEIAARRGARVVGVVGSEDKIGTFIDRIKPLCPSAQCIVRENGAKPFEADLIDACLKARDIDYTHSTCLEAAEDGHGADLVMECYGGKYFRPSLDIINSGGSLSTYGSTTYNGDGGERMPVYSLIWKYLTRPRVDPGELTSRNVRVGGFNLIFLTEETDLLVQSLEACVECLGGKGGDDKESFDDMMARVTPPLIGSSFSFEGGAINALKALRSGKTVGKVVLTNENNPANDT